MLSALKEEESYRWLQGSSRHQLIFLNSLVYTNSVYIMSGFPFVAIVFLLSFMLAGGSAGAVTHLTDCAVLNVTGEVYYLDNDIADSVNTTCFDITADDIILDCQDNIVDGNGTGGTRGVRLYLADNVTVKNCEVTDWDDGLFMYAADDNTIINSNFSSNAEDGIFVSNSDRNLVLNTIVSDNGQYGIHFDTNIIPSNNNVTDCTIVGNSIDGVLISGLNYINTFGILWLSHYQDNQVFSDITLVTDDLVAQGTPFGRVGLYVADNVTLDNITCSGSTKSGLYLYAADDNTIINSNFSSNAEDGIFVSNSDRNLVLNTIVSDNGQYGIHFDTNIIPSNNNIYNNLFNNSVNFLLGGVNYWNTTKTLAENIVGGPYIGGNYWGKPDGIGYSDNCSSDSEGFCALYVLVAGNTDYLPLARYLPVSIDYISVFPFVPYDLDDLECCFVLTDVNVTDLNANVTWYRNDVLVHGFNSTVVNVTNGTLECSPVKVWYLNTSIGEKWVCSVNGYDGMASGWTNSTPVIVTMSPYECQKAMGDPRYQQFYETMCYTGYGIAGFLDPIVLYLVLFVVVLGLVGIVVYKLGGQ